MDIETARSFMQEIEEYVKVDDSPLPQSMSKKDKDMVEEIRTLSRNDRRKLKKIALGLIQNRMK